MLCLEEYEFGYNYMLIYIQEDIVKYYNYNCVNKVWELDKHKKTISKDKLLEELEYIEIENWLDNYSLKSDDEFELLIEFNNNIESIKTNDYGKYNSDFKKLVRLFKYQRTDLLAAFLYKNSYIKPYIMIAPLTILFALPILISILTNSDNKLSNLYLSLLENKLKR